MNKHNDKNHHPEKKVNEKEEQIIKEEPDTVVLSQEEFEKLNAKAKEAQENLDRFLRLQAEFDNARKRMLKEKEEFAKYAHHVLISQLLNVIDDFERAYESSQKKHDYEILCKGVDMIIKNIQDLLKKEGVNVIESVGKPFDPTRHEAISHVETDDKDDNIVVEEVKKGYTINGKVIRPAMVKVSKKKTGSGLQKLEDR